MSGLDRATFGSWLFEHAPRLWVLWAASRPSQVALVVLVYGLGVGMTTVGPPLVVGDATATGPADVLASDFLARVLTGVSALLPVTITIHYANEYADAETDALTDRTPFSGGSGALVRTGLPAAFLRTATVLAFAVAVVAMAAGAASAALSLEAICVLLVLLVAGLAYSLPPVAFVRRGVGEFANAILGGTLLPIYGITVLSTPARGAWLAVVPFTLVVGCNLLATHWPDRKADAAVGKRTLAVRWPAGRLRRAFAVLSTLAGLLTLGLWVGGVFPTAVGVAHLVVAPFLVWSGVVLTRQRSPAPAVIAMVLLALTSTVAWWGVGLGVGG